VTAPSREETVTLLEMTSPDELVPAREAPAPVVLAEIGPEAAAILRSTYVRIGAPHGWAGRTSWSDAQWEGELARPGVRAWIARVGTELAGFVELEAERDGDVGIIVFGLVPEFVGKGYGGEFLTLATRLAWGLAAPDGTPARRVLVQTTSGDHPNALRNYRRRGFRRIRTGRRAASQPVSSRRSP
jgi:RimJ/RimL family protein N-acetyltransferase